MSNIKIKSKTTAMTVILALITAIMLIPSPLQSSSQSNELLNGSGMVNPYAYAQDQEEQGQNVTSVSMAEGAANPNNEQFFVPEVVNIKSGDAVRWTNNDSAPHTATAGSPDTGPSEEFDSGIMSIGDTWEHTFNEVGEIPYYCTLHPWMIGTVVVS